MLSPLHRLQEMQVQAQNGVMQKLLNLQHLVRLSATALQELQAEAGSVAGDGPPLLNKDTAERALMARLR